MRASPVKLRATGWWYHCITSKIKGNWLMISFFFSLFYYYYYFLPEITSEKFIRIPIGSLSVYVLFCVWSSALFISGKRTTSLCQIVVFLFLIVDIIGRSSMYMWSTYRHYLTMNLAPLLLLLFALL